MKTTSNYGLKKPDLTDVVDIQNFNDNADIIDSELSKRALKTDIKVTSVAGKTGAVTLDKTNVGLGSVNNWGASTTVNNTSTTTYATASAVKQAYDKAVEVFNSSTDGKKKLAQAITDKGVSTSASDTFSTMANNINKIAGAVVDGTNINGALNAVTLSTANKKVSTLPYKFSFCCAVVYNNELNFCGGTALYKWNGSTWTRTSTLPYDILKGCVVLYKNEIHILGSDSGSTNHYKWNGSTWTQASTLPFAFYSGGAVVYNNEIHLLGGYVANKSHYKWNGSTWTQVSTLPYEFYNGSVVIYNNEIHMLGSGTYNYRNTHYKWNGQSWTSVSTIPYDFYYGCAVVYNNAIHILGGSDGASSDHFKFTASKWFKQDRLTHRVKASASTIYNNEIHIIGSNYTFDGNTSSCNLHSKIFTKYILI